MNIKLGDILIFEAGDSWLSKSIALLTHSTVSHAAILYRDAAIIEMGGKGITVSQFQETVTGEHAYLLRLQDEPNPAPLIQAADRYLKEGVVYDFADLVLVAGLLIYRAVRPTPRWQKITDLLLNFVCYQLDQLLNQILHSGEKINAMVCSQMVYQIYQDAGKEYEIVLKNALLQADYNSDTVRLIDLVKNSNFDALVMTEFSVKSVDIDSLARELYFALNEAQEVDNNMILQASDVQSLAPVAARFLDLIEKILDTSAINIPLEAMFVAPSDLLEHSENLQQYGTMKLERVN